MDDNNFCLLKSNQSNDNLPEVNLGKTVNNTIIFNSKNNFFQNNTVNGQVNNFKYLNQKDQNLINPQFNNNQNIQNCNINNSLYAKYNNGNEEIKYIKDENNNNIYDIDMNNETEYTFQEKLKEIEKNTQKKNVINIINEPILNNINQNNPCQSQAPTSRLTLSAENIGSQIVDNNDGNSNLNFLVNNTNIETEIYSKTGYGNPFDRSNFNINNLNSNKQKHKNIISKITENINEEKSGEYYLNKLNKIPITESHEEPNINNNNINDEVLNDNNPIMDIPTIKSYYN